MKELLEKYLQEIQQAEKDHYAEMKFSMPVPTFEYTDGKRFWKIVENDQQGKHVQCFVEKSTGDIYKAATWNTPAKGVRGNLKDEKKPLRCGDFYKRK